MGECGADTGATDPAGATDGATEPAGAQTTASSDELRKQAEDAAARVAANNNLIDEKNQNIANAESATDAIDDIKEKLSPTATTTGRRLRQKRQDSTDGPTPMPVEVPGTCADFGEAYKKLLDLAADVNDGNIDQIKVYVDVLINVIIEDLCDSPARETLATETNAKADAAIESTKKYTDATEKEVTELKQMVNDDIALQESINEELENRNEDTVPAEEETPEGTPPAEGETPEGTPPVEGETPEGTPSMQISTANPARMLFERKRRSRGSMF